MARHQDASDTYKINSSMARCRHTSIVMASWHVALLANKITSTSTDTLSNTSLIHSPAELLLSATQSVSKTCRHRRSITLENSYAPTLEQAIPTSPNLSLATIWETHNNSRASCNNPNKSLAKRHPTSRNRNLRATTTTLDSREIQHNSQVTHSYVSNF